MTILGIIGSQELVLIFIVLVFIFLLPIIALIDILKNKFEGNNKLIWIIVVILMSIIGSILYFTIGRKQKIRNN